MADPFPCQHCGAELPSPASQIANWINCPHCRQTTRVPAPSILQRSSETAAAEPVRAPVALPQPSGASDFYYERSRMVGFWSLLLMATLCIGGYYCWYHWMITTRCFEEPTRITIEELAQGRFPKNCYVTITDPVLLPNAGVELRDDRTFKPWRQYWAPLTSRTEALAGAEPRAKLVLYYKQYVFSKDLQMLLDRSEFTGLVLYKVTTVDGHALDLMSRIYPEVNDEDVLVFEIGEEPMSRYLLYPLMALLAIVSALIAVPIVSWLRRSPNDEM